MAEEDMHDEQDHGFIVMSGRGICRAAGQDFKLEPGAVLFIPSKTPHSIEVVGHETLRLGVILAPANKL
jgi:mannose-6-phosphate isomerase-like protein (cupin superfamily)